MKRNGKAGLAEEQISTDYLRQKGYRILERNYRSRYGEIDIIACDSQYIVFVEVKARKPGAIMTGLEAVTQQKQRKIVATALCYLEQHPTSLQPRFDVITLSTTGQRKLRHLENAFTGEAENEIF